MTTTDDDYIHGYHEAESTRLQAQAWSVLELLHHDTRFAPGARVLEVGCGTGAQTTTLARNSPDAQIVAVDRSETSIARARDRVARARLANVQFHLADLFELPFETHSFDDVFVCFVLEHLEDPAAALRVLRSLLKPGGTITVFEGDHGSAYFHPQSAYADAAIACQVTLQQRAGGNALIGRQLYPLLTRAGFGEVHVSPRMVYVDGSRPELIETFTRGTFTAMIEGVRGRAIDAGLSTPAQFDRGIDDLGRTAARDGVFCYTFFKGVGVEEGN